MARKGNRQLIRLRNPKTGTFYISEKNRVNSPDKLEVKKFDPKENEGKGGHGIFKEEKVK